MTMYAKRYEILRGLITSGRTQAAQQPSGEPKYAVLLLNEAKFLQSGNAMIHWDTVFFDDKNHDWQYINNLFYYHSHALGADDVGDVLIVYETSDGVQ